ncbi:SMP-30/gluconolactonase/LRE family protein [Agrobacterium sp. ES01]|uniref:SMP-30/gluconolactonase/LRE family protein n=1 Tax=Agrobacterium sp. ES01 TaxID=3420714 RepID=UPI003D143240
MTIITANTHKLPAPPCHLGEGPSYDVSTDTAFWFDITGKTLWEHRFETGEIISHDLPVMASVLARVDDDRQLMAAEDGIYLRMRSTGALSLLTPMEADNPGNRSNDGRVHPSGKLWIGTMGKNAEWQAGTIYIFDGQDLKPIVRKVTIPNSICFSPDGRTGYYSDTAINTVWRIPLDPQTGMPIGEPEIFLQEPSLPLGGHYDGSVVDANGVLWNAAWGGGSVSGFAPDGSLVGTYELQAAQTSCPCFVGKKLDKMLVTSAWQGYSDAQRAADPGAGFTYMIDGGFKGLADSSFKLLQEARA